jgi:hypothetical protein
VQIAEFPPPVVSKEKEKGSVCNLHWKCKVSRAGPSPGWGLRAQQLLWADCPSFSSQLSSLRGRGERGAFRRDHLLLFRGHWWVHEPALAAHCA